jgi:hypothetical protein
MSLDLASQTPNTQSVMALSTFHEQIDKSNSALTGTLFGRQVTSLKTDLNNLSSKSPEDRLDILSQNVPGFNRELFKEHNGHIVKNQDSFHFSAEEKVEIDGIIHHQLQPLHQKLTNIACAKMWFQLAAIISAVVSSLFTLVSHLGLMVASAFVTPISIIGGIAFAASFIASWYEGSKREELKEIATGLDNRRSQKTMEILHKQIIAIDNFFDVFVNGEIVDEKSQNSSSRSISNGGLFEV